MADLGGTPTRRPKIFSISCSFSENFGKIVCWPLGGLAPLIREFLDPPLERISYLVVFYNIIFSAKEDGGMKCVFCSVLVHTSKYFFKVLMCLK